MRILKTLFVFFALCVLSCGGCLYWISRQPHHGPAPRNDVAKQVVEPAAEKLPVARGVVPPVGATEQKDDVIPGMVAADLHLNLEKRGFAITKRLNNVQSEWSCKKETSNLILTAGAFGKGPTKINCIHATALNMGESEAETDDLCRDFMGFVATIPYDGAEPQNAKTWVLNNLGQSAITVFGGAEYELFINPEVPRFRSLRITPVNLLRKAEREAIEQATKEADEQRIESTRKETLTSELERREKAASGKLRLCQKLIDQGKVDTAKHWLANLIREYPGTTGAREADALLKSL